MNSWVKPHPIKKFSSEEREFCFYFDGDQEYAKSQADERSL
jgi:hypothetical protein